MNHYEALGVGRDCTQFDITMAYRRKAQKLHPDRDSGDAEQFKRVKEAYEVLKDPKRRERYDRTGDDSGAVDIEQVARQQLIVLFVNTVDELRGDSIKYNNLIMKIVKKVTEKQEEIFKEQETNRDNTAKYLDAVSRMSSKVEGNELFDNAVAALKARAQVCEQNVANCEEATKIGVRILELLDGFEYRSDEITEATKIQFIKYGEWGDPGSVPWP